MNPRLPAIFLHQHLKSSGPVKPNMFRSRDGGERRLGLPFWLLTIFLAIIFLTGGSSRSDVSSLLILYPAAFIACAAALMTLRLDHVRSNIFIMVMAMLVVTLAVLHVIPLPPSIWQNLPGRAIITDVDRLARIDGAWRPLTLSPMASRDTLYGLAIPLAVLLFGIQMRRDECFKLVHVALALGLASGFLGLLQALGDPQSALYFYRITNNDAAVGLFANRNHQATMLAALFAMLAFYASWGTRSDGQGKLKRIIALAAGAVLVPLILVTGSRSGIVTGTIGLIAGVMLYSPAQPSDRPRRKTAGFNPLYAATGAAILFLGLITILMARAVAFERLWERGPEDDLRWRLWQQVADAAAQYLPWGTGNGSFVPVYQILEADRALGPNYVNRVHNDFIELFLTSGVPGLMLLGVAIMAAAVASYRAFASKKRSAATALARVGAVTLAILAMASLTDYPLRTPIGAALFMLAILWLGSGLKAEKPLAVDQRLG
jgi:O-antigen ligase